MKLLKVNQGRLNILNIKPKTVRGKYIARGGWPRRNPQPGRAAARVAHPA